MKKPAIVLLISFFSCIQVIGQQYSICIKPSFLIIGANYTQEPSVMGVSLSSRGSYGLGITFTDQLNKHFGLKLEPRFIAKGYDIKWSSENKDIYKNNYLSIPILIYFSPIKNLSLEFGSDISYLLNSKYKSSGSNSFLKSDSPDLKQFEFSLITGFNYKLSQNTDIGARYGFGLTPSEKGIMRISDWTGPQVIHKYVQSYFEIYLNINILNKPKHN